MLLSQGNEAFYWRSARLPIFVSPGCKIARGRGWTGSALPPSYGETRAWGGVCRVRRYWVGGQYGITENTDGLNTHSASSHQ